MVDALARFAQVRQFGSLFHYELAPERGLVLFRAVGSCLKGLIWLRLKPACLVWVMNLSCFNVERS